MAAWPTSVLAAGQTWCTQAQGPRWCTLVIYLDSRACAILKIIRAKGKLSKNIILCMGAATNQSIHQAEKA